MTTEHKPHSEADDVAERSFTESPMVSGANRSASVGPRWPKMARVITCLNCGGRGFIAYIAGNGMKRPRKCMGCNGTGQQEVLNG